MKKKKTDQPDQEKLGIDRRERFCLEYAIDHHGTKAAIRAGYGKQYAVKQACRLLAMPEIQRRIASLMAVTADQLGISRAKVMKQYANIAFFDIRKIYDKTNKLKSVSEFDDSAAAAVAGIEVENFAELFTTVTKVKVRDSKAALDSLCKLMGWNAAEKVDHTTDGESLNNSGMDNLSADERLQLFRLRQKMKGDEQA